jgi:IS6 family transposase
LVSGEGVWMSHHRNQSPPVDRFPFTGYRFPPEVILLAVRCYLRYGLSYRDVEELLVERGIEVDHVTIHRWVQRFTPLLIDAARTFFTTALAAHGEPDEVITDLAQALETVIEDLIPDAFHNTDQYANNRVECDHGRLKARLRPMRGLKTDRTASVVIRGHAFIQNLRRGHYELGAESLHPHLRIASAFEELTETI